MKDPDKRPVCSLIEYKGLINGELRLCLFDLVKYAALYNLGKRSDLKRLVGIALELLDNAQRYSSGQEVSFTWHIEGDQLVASISNRASHKDAMRLKRVVESIEAMTTQEIADAFKEQLIHEGFSDKGGAGLGMLQIARKKGRSVEAKVLPIHANEYLCTSTVIASLEAPHRA